MVVMVVPRHLQSLVLPLPLAFVPPVLEPDLDLGGGELQGAGQVLSLRGGQVALLLEAPLQLEHLSLGEEDAGFPPGPLLLGGGFVQVWLLTVSAQRPAALCEENKVYIKTELRRIVIFKNVCSMIFSGHNIMI